MVIIHALVSYCYPKVYEKIVLFKHPFWSDKSPNTPYFPLVSKPFGVIWIRKIKDTRIIANMILPVLNNNCNKPEVALYV